jgi:membrane protein DedA with SNARE-associated domain
MIETALASLEAWIRVNAGWAGPVTFAIAFLESFPLVSILVPSTALLLALGAMIGGGLLEPWPVLIGCVAGGILGDAGGFWLARAVGPHRIRRRLPRNWRRPYAWATRLFLRFGWSAVFFGRFIGPLRAVTPLAAGVIRMGHWRFQSANVLSAIVWAPVMIMPGSIGGWIASQVDRDNAPQALALAAVLGGGGWLLYQRLAPLLRGWLRARFGAPALGTAGE